MKTTKSLFYAFLLMGILLTSCGPSPAEQAATSTQAAADSFATMTAQAPTATPTYTPTPTATATPTSTPTPRPTNTPRPTPTPKPSLSSVALTLDDLPAGFEAMPAADVRTMEQAYPDGTKAFGFQDPMLSQVVIGVLIPYASRDEQLLFDSMLPQFVQLVATGVAPDTTPTQLKNVEDIGEACEGITTKSKIGYLSMRWDIIAFRRGKVGMLAYIGYPDGDQPAMPLDEIARLLDERAQSFPASSPSSSITAPVAQSPVISSLSF